jgi:dienelactone hydrolase
MITRLVSLLLVALALPKAASAETPATVYFASGDGHTELVGYLFSPTERGPHPAIVMLHGRSGPYSTNVNADCTLVARSVSSDCDATTLSKRHAMWGQYWAERGYVALLVDSFGPRGKAHGFGRFTHGDPDRDDVNEKTVRPLDAEGALAYLRTRNDVVAGNIFLQGWSNGGSTLLNVVYRQGMQTTGFRAALAFYPGCGRAALLAPTIATAVPVTMFLGSDDEEVSPDICKHVAERSRDAGSPIDVIWYDGATHDFDDPGASRQSIPGNRAARADALQRAINLIQARRAN